MTGPGPRSRGFAGQDVGLPGQDRESSIGGAGLAQKQGPTTFSQSLSRCSAPQAGKLHRSRPSRGSRRRPPRAHQHRRPVVHDAEGGADGGVDGIAEGIHVQRANNGHGSLPMQGRGLDAGLPRASGKGLWRTETARNFVADEEQAEQGRCRNHHRAPRGASIFPPAKTNSSQEGVEAAPAGSRTG
jgi:hypothetical protein